MHAFPIAQTGMKTQSVLSAANVVSWIFLAVWCTTAASAPLGGTSLTVPAHCPVSIIITAETEISLVCSDTWATGERTTRSRSAHWPSRKLPVRGARATLILRFTQSQLRQGRHQVVGIRRRAAAASERWHEEGQQAIPLDSWQPENG